MHGSVIGKDAMKYWQLEGIAVAKDAMRYGGYRSELDLSIQRGLDDVLRATDYLSGFNAADQRRGFESFLSQYGLGYQDLMSTPLYDTNPFIRSYVSEERLKAAQAAVGHGTQM